MRISNIRMPLLAAAIPPSSDGRAGALTVHRAVRLGEAVVAGLTDARRVAALAHARGVAVAPHVRGSAVLRAPSLQFAPAIVAV